MSTVEACSPPTSRSLPNLLSLLNDPEVSIEDQVQAVSVRLPPRQSLLQGRYYGDARRIMTSENVIHSGRAQDHQLPSLWPQEVPAPLSFWDCWNTLKMCVCPCFGRESGYMIDDCVAMPNSAKPEENQPFATGYLTPLDRLMACATPTEESKLSEQPTESREFRIDVDSEIDELHSDEYVEVELD